MSATARATAYLIAALIGATVGVLVGYFTYAASYGNAAVPFSFWLGDVLKRWIYVWALTGALIGIGLRFLQVTR